MFRPPSRKTSVSRRETDRARKNRFRARTLESAALAVAGSAIASGASAAIIPGPGITYNEGDTVDLGPISFDLQLDTGMSGNEINLLLDGGMNSMAVTFAFENGAGMMDGWLMDYGAGQTVDGSLSYSRKAFLVQDPGVTQDWVTGQTAYAGFSFQLDASTTAYGWVELTFDSGGQNFQITNWAYEDSGAPIATGVVPEPSTALLLGLALAGLAAGARKAKRSPGG